MGTLQQPSPELISLTLLLCAIPMAVYFALLPPHKTVPFFGRRYNMPNGPRGRIIVGNLPEWLQARNSGQMIPWLVEQAQYGEFTTLSMGTKTWVLLNTGRVANEIISKRASITHERPHFPIAGTLVSRNKRLFLQKTNKWREGRRLLHQLTLGASSKDDGDVVQAASLGLLQAYLDEPAQWYAHHYRYAVAIMNKLVTNAPLRKRRSELEDLQLVTSTFLTSINSSLVEFFPQAAYLPRPLQLWRHKWEKIGDFNYNVFKSWWDAMKPVRGDTAPTSFVRDTILETYSGTEDESMYLTMLAIVAGADNPRMAMNAWMMACLAHPGVMQRARVEIDRVCEGDTARLPNLDDLPNMPYMCAVIKEVLRWRPIVPLVPQRVLVQDLHFEEYSFPAGTEFLVNSIPVCTSGYKNPSDFCPERWLGSDKCGSGVEQDLWQYAFSGGRRSCVGYKLAQKELFLSFSRLLYCFDFSPAGTFNDKQLNAFTPGEPFPVKAVIRSSVHERLIRQEAKNCEIWGS